MGKYFIYITAEKMHCITGKLENEMEGGKAKAGAGEYWWSGKKNHINVNLNLEECLEKLLLSLFSLACQPNRRADYKGHFKDALKFVFTMQVQESWP